MSGSDLESLTRDHVFQVRGLKKYFDIKMGIAGLWAKTQDQVKAVDDISFNIRSREIISFVGETGCGKTTVGRLLLRLDDPTEGSILFEGIDIASLKAKQIKEFRKKVQMIFQDPYASLNPRMTVSQSVAEPLINYGFAKQPEILTERVAKSLQDAGLRPINEYLERFPHELSGGERQRVSIARALVMEPSFIVADEPVSMLDVSIRAGVMNLMLNLRNQYGIAYQLITHDISVARYMSDRIAIMYLGKIMELADTETIINNPVHPYTRALIKAVPIADPTRERPPLPILGEIPSPLARPTGCVFHTRCIFAKESCAHEFTDLQQVGDDHFVACDQGAAGELPEPEKVDLSKVYEEEQGTM
jgi:oligopeptide/dipeptide ABC transporter ATP-binding protein